eukprot:TRINITY_DN10703_c0_g1_i3.p1 TRINITY_DN10703_c0_g1~~TRINITY_DN10703_c0_g1_i3.p1  ORF type:complete len:301 (+),score=24.96 TRINITY_DN10703_c0_g1_i3:1116-2018(+)
MVWISSAKLVLIVTYHTSMPMAIRHFTSHFPDCDPVFVASLICPEVINRQNAAGATPLAVCLRKQSNTPLGVPLVKLLLTSGALPVGVIKHSPHRQWNVLSYTLFVIPRAQRFDIAKMLFKHNVPLPSDDRLELLIKSIVNWASYCDPAYSLFKYLVRPSQPLAAHYAMAGLALSEAKLKSALKQKSMETIERMVALGADINYLNKGRTVLWVLLTCAPNQLVFAIPVAKELIRLGADIRHCMTARFDLIRFWELRLGAITTATSGQTTAQAESHLHAIRELCTYAQSVCKHRIKTKLRM